MKKIILKKKPVLYKQLIELKIILKRKQLFAVQLLTDEEIELASIAASYYALTFPAFEEGSEWKAAREDTEWLAEQGHKMINGPYAWLNEADFTREELDEYFAQKG